MESGLINKALKEFALREGKDLKEIQQYLLMKYRIEVDTFVLEKRLKKMQLDQKRVA